MALRRDVIPHLFAPVIPALTEAERSDSVSLLTFHWGCVMSVIYMNDLGFLTEKEECQLFELERSQFFANLLLA